MLRETMVNEDSGGWGHVHHKREQQTVVISDCSTIYGVADRVYFPTIKSHSNEQVVELDAHNNQAHETGHD